MKIILSEKQLKRIIQENIEELNYQSLQDDENLQDLRDSIDKNKLVSVAFVKKDGSVKHMLIRKSLSSYMGSDREKTDAQRNVEMNHDLKKVVDVNAYKREMKYLRSENPEMDMDTIKQMASKKAWRSVNLRNVLGFMVGGRFIDLRDENEIMDRFGETVHGQLTKSMIGAMQAQAPVNDNPEGDVNEGNPILKFLRGTVNPEVKILAKGTHGDIAALKNQAAKGLLTKFGTVQMTDFVKTSLRPFEDNMVIFVNDYKNLQKYKKPPVASADGRKYDYVAFLDQQISAVRDNMAVAKGKPIFIDHLYANTNRLNSYIDDIIQSKQVTPQGVTMLKNMKVRVGNALDAIEDALGQMSLK
jgi:hypothetical protein